MDETPGVGVKYYSQSDEDGVIFEFFRGKPKGRFLDIGCHDGIHLSNVRRLYEEGWSGVMVEAAAGPFRSLMANYEGDERTVLVHAAVCPTNRTWLQFNQNDDFTSTSSEAHKAKWEGTTPYIGTWVAGVPWADLIMQFPGPYHMINLDIEGANWGVFEQILITDVAELKLICVEYDDKKDQMISAASVRGFELLHWTSENLILVR